MPSHVALHTSNVKNTSQYPRRQQNAKVFTASPARHFTEEKNNKFLGICVHSLWPLNVEGFPFAGWQRYVKNKFVHLRS